MAALKKVFLFLLSIFGYKPYEPALDRLIRSAKPLRLLRRFRFNLRVGNGEVFSASWVQAGVGELVICRAHILGQSTLYERFGLGTGASFWIWDDVHATARRFELTYDSVEWTEPFVLDACASEFLMETVTLRGVKYMLPDDVTIEEMTLQGNVAQIPQSPPVSTVVARPALTIDKMLDTPT